MMDFDLNDIPIINNERAQRFEAHVGSLVALLTYLRFPDRIVYNHTEVPSVLEGQGLAAKLTKTALDFARSNDLRVVPRCSYVSAYIAKHQEYQDLVAR
jgi:predicted GNAT family acetyltransferase